MSRDPRTGFQQSTPSKETYLARGRESPEANADDWSNAQSSTERRKIQNKLAQRRFREKIKDQREETEREVENQRKAGSSYASPEPESIDTSQTLSGLPWGGISMKHIVEKGKIKEQSSQQSSRENSVYESTSHVGAGNSR
ncbi:hypothetical protein BDW02DRAFT_488596 [Decorospora gaudefroyi]|uniref:BZIP domain-containing protein n=1 Tax=Decorospora gaudefroyi TaxID=184978 RepID=A0A6A5KRD9_9PLEO|nr:hypothetical protein BDW02DRAFT_488596 [Decorospora gaudefroyi]